MHIGRWAFVFYLFRSIGPLAILTREDKWVRRCYTAGVFADAWWDVSRKRTSIPQ